MLDLAYDFDVDDEQYFVDDEDEIYGIIDKFMNEETKINTATPQKNERGRPRKHFTKKVTMIEMEASGWLIRASRGRPKKGEVRVEVEVPFDLEVVSKRFYTCENGVLTETWTSDK